MALSKVQEEAGLPKWKVALAVGGTLAAGYAMYHFMFRQSGKKQDKSKTTPKQSSEETESLASPNTDDTASLVRAAPQPLQGVCVVTVHGCSGTPLCNSRQAAAQPVSVPINGHAGLCGAACPCPPIPASTAMPHAVTVTCRMQLTGGWIMWGRE